MAHFGDGEFQDGMLDYSVDAAELRVSVATGMQSFKRRTNEEQKSGPVEFPRQSKPKTKSLIIKDHFVAQALLKSQEEER